MPLALKTKEVQINKNDMIKIEGLKKCRSSEINNRSTPE